MPGSTATYPEQTASATLPYSASAANSLAPSYSATPPTSTYPTTGAPTATSYPATYPSTSATASNSIPAQTGPYNPVYGGGSSPGATAVASYPSTPYPSTHVDHAPSTSGGNGTVSNVYAGGAPQGDTAGRYDDRYSSAPAVAAPVNNQNLTEAPSNATAPATSGDRYAASADRYAGFSEPSGATAPTDRYAANATESQGAATTDRYARSDAAPGNYQPGTTGYDPGNTGYNPPGVADYRSGNSYTSPTSHAAAVTPRRDPFYRPGDTTDYHPATGSSAVNSYASPASNPGAPASNAAGGYGSAGAGQQVPASSPYVSDRYGTQPSQPPARY